MERTLTQAQMDFYMEILQCINDALNAMEQENYIPKEIADRIWNICDSSNYGRIREATKFITVLYDSLVNNLVNAYGDRPSYSPDDVYQIVGNWVESKATRMIREYGWQQDRNGEWYQVNNSFVRNRGIESRVTGRRNNMGVGIHRPTGFQSNIRGPGLRPVQAVGQDWSQGIAIGAADPIPTPQQRPMQQPGLNNNEAVVRDAITMHSDNFTRNVQTPTQRQPQRSETVSQYKDIEEDLERSRQVTYEYTPATEEKLSEENARALDHAMRVDDVIAVEGSDGTEFTVYDLKFNVPSSSKIVATFAQTFFSHTESYLARIKFSQVKRFSLPGELYDKALKHIRPAQEDIVKDDKPGAILDSVIFDNFTRNDGRRVEKFIVDEINRRLEIVFYNRRDVTDLLEIEEVKDIDDVINYQPYLNLLGKEADRYKTLVRYMINDVIYTLFTRADRITRDTKRLDILVEAEEENRFIHQGVGMSQALLGDNEATKNTYLDEYFKRFTVLKMDGIAFYTDVFEDGREPGSLILQSHPKDVYDRVLMAALEARNEKKGNKGFTLKDAASYSELTLFIRRPDVAYAYNVTFPCVPTPNKVLKRNPSLDVGYILPTDEEDVSEDNTVSPEDTDSWEEADISHPEVEASDSIEE